MNAGDCMPVEVLARLFNVSVPAMSATLYRKAVQSERWALEQACKKTLRRGELSAEEFRASAKAYRREARRGDPDAPGGPEVREPASAFEAHEHVRKAFAARMRERFLS